MLCLRQASDFEVLEPGGGGVVLDGDGAFAGRAIVFQDFGAVQPMFDVAGADDDAGFVELPTVARLPFSSILK